MTLPDPDDRPLPRYWIEQILRAEHSDERFEQFAVEATQSITGQPVSGTSRSWDLGRDGRSLRAGAHLYVAASLEDTPAKAGKDAARLVEELRAHSRAMPREFYFLTPRPAASEHGIEKIVDAAREHLPDAAISAWAEKQIVDAVHSGQLSNIFRKYYGSDIASLRLATAPPGEDDVHVQHLQLALGTYAAADAGGLRAELHFRIVVRLLESEPQTERDLLTRVEQVYGFSAFSQAALSQACQELLRLGAIEGAGGGNWRLTPLGLQLLASYRSEQAASELEGSNAVRAAVEASLEKPVDDRHWKGIWLHLQNEIAGVFFQKGRELLATLSAFLDKKQEKAPDKAFSELLDTAFGRTASASTEAPLRAEIKQALHDAFLPGAANAAFGWLT